MGATPQDVQAKIDAAVAALKQTTVGYLSKRPCSHAWTTPPPGTNWALALDALVAARAEAGQLVAPAPPAPSGNPVPPPASGCYFGAYIEGAQTYAHYFGGTWDNPPYLDPGVQHPWPKFNADAGKPVSMLMFGQGVPWERPFQQFLFDNTVAGGAIPVIDAANFGPSPTLADLASGVEDVQITAWFKSVAAWGKPIVFRWDAEMNGTWYRYGAEAKLNPQVFIDCWRRIHNLAVDAGAKNVSWHWCPNVDPEANHTPLEALYPGDAYVDWTGMTGYNHGGEAFDWVFSSTYARLVALAPSKPIMIGEIGSCDVTVPSTNPTKEQWLADFFAKLPAAYPQVRAFCWFNWYILENGQEWDWPIESSPAALAAFQKGIASSYFV